MFIRYPGSKAKLFAFIADFLPDEVKYPLWSGSVGAYAEPFFGSGAIGWRILTLLDNPSFRLVVVNDLDPGIAALWQAVRDAPRELIRLIRAFQPTAEAFYAFKESDGSSALDPVVRGFRKLALHQLSFSGLGFMAGGPLGGKTGRSEYNPECRWSPPHLVKKITWCHHLMKRFGSGFQVHCQDFETVLQALPPDAFVYLDPPYYAQGSVLYKHSMSEADHQRLAAFLKTASFRWVLSYDDHPSIRALYSWASIRSFTMTPTIPTARTPTRRKNSEVVIAPAFLSCPGTQPSKVV